MQSFCQVMSLRRTYQDNRFIDFLLRLLYDLSEEILRRIKIIKSKRVNSKISMFRTFVRGHAKDLLRLDVKPIVLYQTRRIHLWDYLCTRHNVVFSKNNMATQSEKIRQDDVFMITSMISQHKRQDFLLRSMHSSLEYLKLILKYCFENCVYIPSLFKNFSVISLKFVIS